MAMAVEHIARLTEILLPLHFFEGLFSEYRRSYTAIVYYVALFMAVFFRVHVGVLLVISLVGNYLTYKTRLLPCVFITALYYLILVLSNVLCAAALTSAGYAPDYDLGGPGRAAYLVSAKLLTLFLTQIALLVFRRDRPHSFPLISVPLLVCQALSIFACWRSFSALTVGADSETVLLTALCLLLINIIICFYIKILENYYQHTASAAAAGELAELQRKYFENMTARQEETRALWHDIKKYVSAMETMVTSDKTAEAEKCFEEIREKYEGLSTGVDVGNSVINSILSDATRRARDAGIDLHLNVWVAPELNIPPTDLYIIIGNTLDNALEACGRLPKERRAVELLLRQSNHLLYYELSNPYLPDEAPKKGGVHGYGLRNVRACVEKNKGAVELSSGDGRFTVSVQLNV